MAAEKSPAFQLYVNEFRASRSVQRMSFAERGMYLEMLMEEWQSLTLPDDAEAVASLIATSAAQHAEVLAAWPALRRKFVTLERQPGRIVNTKLEKVRRERHKFRFVKTLAGREGGKAKARNVAARKALEAARLLASASTLPELALAKPTSSSSSSTASSSSSSSSTATGLMRQGKEPPMQMGLRRFSVWRWMLDDVIGMLGDHAESFDLEAWLLDLDNSVHVLPAQTWPWWKEQVAIEARRRGYPMEGVTVQPMGKQTTRLGAAVANIMREAQS